MSENRVTYRHREGVARGTVWSPADGAPGSRWVVSESGELHKVTPLRKAHGAGAPTHQSDGCVYRGDGTVKEAAPPEVPQ